MAQDFANRKKARAKKKNKTQPKTTGFSFGSFILGMVVGVGLFLVTAYAPELFGRKSPLASPSEPAVANQTDPNTSTPPNAAASEPAPSATEVEFVFRDLLTKDAPPPDVSAYEPISDPSNTPNTADTPGASGATAPQPNSQYLLQSGSFQILADAERRRGELLLMNLPANVVEANIDDNIWYRVVVGPFAERSSANRVVTALRERQIAAIWLARPATN